MKNPTTNFSDEDLRIAGRAVAAILYTCNDSKLCMETVETVIETVVRSGKFKTIQEIVEEAVALFPQKPVLGEFNLEQLRDEFAGKAMQALLSNPMASREIARDAEEKTAGTETQRFGLEIARNAFDIANAMIRERIRNDREHPISHFIPPECKA